MRPLTISLALSGALCGLLTACSATQDAADFANEGGAGGAGGAVAGTGGSGGLGGAGGSTNGGGEGGGGPTTGTGGGLPAGEAEVFAHTGDTLYRLDPLTKGVTAVGGFSGCDGSVIDIALDKDGAMFGTTFSALYTIDKKTAQCHHIASGSYPNSLSFVPKGSLDASEEALVGYVGADYIRIDRVTGAISKVGALGGGYISSGDIVSVIGGGTYLTVKQGGCGDCIVEVNPKTGAFVKNIGALGYSNVFGLAFWGGSAYGFNDAGQLFQIDLTNAQTTALSMPGVPAGLKFYGAGSSTAAPLVVPK
jgi:hypothetical protein